MAESRTKKKSPRQKESDTKIEQRGETINNYITLKNPGIVQVGSGNVVFKEGKSLLDDTQGGISKNDVFVGMVNSIINPTCSEKAIEMSMKIVEERFTKQYRRHCSTVKSFKDAYGAPLRKFIETNSEYYDMYSTKGKQTIRLKWRDRKKSEDSKEVRKSVTCTASVHSDPKSTLPLKEARNECTEEKVEVQKLGEASGYATENDDDEENLNSEPWQQQKSKRSEKKSVLKVHSVETSQSISKEESTSSGTEEIYNSERFMVRDLLRKDESDVLLFYPDESIYMDGQAIFMQDIVSLWNTPSRHTSSVVIGVCLNQTKPHSVVGVRVRSSDDFYQAYFNKDHFSMMPNFKYKEVVYQDKVIGIIDVQSSYGQGVPSVVTKDFTDSNQLTLTAGQLWVRSGRHNRLSLPQDFLTGQIYQWFGGTGQMSVEENTETTRQVIDKGDFEYPDEEYSATIKRGVTTADFCSAVDYFKKGHFVLITGSLPESVRHVDNLALVSWLAVYDFEESSRHSGLLSCLEDVIKRKRYLHVSTWKDSPQGITESGTQWICLRGLCEIPDTQTSHNPNGWLQLVKGNLNSTCLNLARFSEDYTVLRLIVLWPDNEIQAQCVYKFLCKLNDHFHVQPKIIVCLLQELNSSVGKSVLQLLESDYNTNLVQLKIDLESLCLSVGNMLKEISKQREMDYSLPKQESHMHADVTDKDAAWLREDLVVLYLSSPYTKGEADVEELTKEVDCFFKGGSLHWCARYAFGTTHVDVERDIMKYIIEHVEQKLIKEFRSATVTIFHAPGAGGTTLAQRILWELRKICPCCQLKQRPGILIEEVLAKIQYLYDVSGLPVVLLIDGEDEPRVKQIMKKLKSGCIIVIYAKRYPYAIKEPLQRPKDNKFWLRGEVTEDEAKILSFKFLERCQEDNRKKVLSKMCKDVQQKKRHHVMYEFGMAVYHHEFRGIETYVKGYLRLEENPTRHLLSWQKILGYLSLVYFYGQTSMPCQVFARLLGKQSNFDVCIDDFPYPIMEFVVEDASDGREKNIRISNYYLAKEILEQVLNRSSTKQDTRLQTLSKKAKHNLKEFCLEFISMFSSRRTRSSLTAHNIIKILTRTFIYRDNKDVGENEVQIKKRPLFSQLICDIDMNSPFTGRLEVLRRLSSSFPDDPNFLAHLGRFYAHCRQEEEDKAERCFEDALDLCKKWNDGPLTSVTEEWRKLTLMHIYHMYGTIYQRRVGKYTGRSQGSKPETETTEGEFNLRIEELVRDADTACSYFTHCRQNAPSGYEECYGYSSEIRVRLQVCDFVNRNYTNGGVSGFLTKHGRHGEPVAEFIMDSITDIEDMILECYSLIDPGNLDQTFHSAVLWYDQLFERNMFDIHRLDNMSVTSRRLLIAANKLKYTRKGHHSVFEISNIPEADIIEFINLYEENFKDASVMGDFSKRQLESDFKEWLVAIRHPHFPSTYSEQDVLSKIRYWYETLHSPTSTFYLFVVLSLVGFGSAECKGNSESLVQAQMLKDDMDKFIKSVSKPRYPQEWLGKNNSGIKRLIPRSRLSAQIEGRNIQSTPHSLLVCKGTIAHPNSNRLSGYIDLDLGQNSVPVKVFFIPIRAGLVGTRFAGQRVQFYLAFSFHGNEAYNVQELTKHQCLVCLKKTEIQMDKETVQCSCGAVVEKHELL
ncbi:uncharacterized protein LOC124146127 [Haliotis rufescens]|uniref:uncharacterized protein LOC124146127 n=1 Tax=Haliotis rufescens TaxID=6454 RepID=UPI00201F38D3|nr:uncharacterized protein LOC124146127 [Haliotis rufescens]